MVSTVTLSVTEGKYRMVRRMLHNAGHSVLALHRIQYGECSLDEASHPSDSVVHCEPSELAWFKFVLKSLQAEKKNKQKQGLKGKPATASSNAATTSTATTSVPVVKKFKEESEVKQKKSSTSSFLDAVDYL